MSFPAVSVPSDAASDLPTVTDVRADDVTTAPADVDVPVVAADIDSADIDSAELDSDLDEDVEELASPAEPGFESLGLPASLMRAVTSLGYTVPTAIQAQAIPALLSGRDITGVAQTGTGKTAAFGLPLLAAVDPSIPQVQALVLTPTRELAQQVAEAISGFAQHQHKLNVVAIYGGASFLPQRNALRSGAQVVVGTPGRIIDHLERNTLDVTGIRFLVLDEADEMLRMGFAEDVDRILTDAPKDRQTALFSATMPPAIRSVAKRHLNNPVDVTVSRQSSTVAGVRQTYAVVPFREKVDVLTRYLSVHPGDASIVFVRTKGACDEVGAELIARGVSAAAINGDVPQKERERIIERLKDGRLDVLVATDVAARGLDVDRIDLVVNFDAPTEAESYVHRIGRTGRAGRTGEALTFFTPRETARLRSIERVTGQKLEQITPPTAAQVAAHVATEQLTTAVTRLDGPGLAPYRAAVTARLALGDVTVEELAAALLALAAGDDGTRRPEATPSTFVAERPGRDAAFGADRPRRADRGPAGPRYRLAVGRDHGVRPAGIVGAITAEGGLAGKDVGRIDIYDTYSTVEIAGDLNPATIGKISNAKVSGQSLRIQPDHGAPPAAAGPRGPRRSGPGRDERGDRGQGRGGERGGFRERRSFAR
ncbi:DEAD/DEAH box helicase [Nakamurella flavida]|uniref:RNA helicase n=1 Tax=Nakamurella flavida TaxID=363630 RepID=A0A938YLI8_9ACTN|nr:DEAD/DEAH box helicase [Nakamurella flavida]MBM9477384.1 DEAD/DEAH box helicase [Nakamurella flavida]MDP9777316.1 ATP-dependent RNA helicase DeaD [Nakamurella flavida]